MAARSPREVYQSPLVGRYTSEEMQLVFSDNFKFGTWRKVWLALAEAQHELGLRQVTGEMVEEMRQALEEPIDYKFVAAREKKIRHDVNYRGFRVSILQAKEIIEFWDKCGKEVVQILYREI